MTDRTFLRCIGRVNVDHGYASNSGFVVYELPELVEAPRTMSMSLRLGSDRCPLSDATEIFKGNQGRGVFGFHDNILGNAMVRVSLEPSFMTGKLLQMSFGTICTATLKICLEVIKFGSGLFNLLAREYLTHRIYSYVLNSEIHTDNAYWQGLFGFRNFDHDTKIELSASEDQISLTSDPVHSGSMIIADLNRKLDPASESQQRDSIKSFPRHDSLVIDDCTVRIKDRLDRLVSLISFGCLGNGSNSHLGGYTKLLSEISINNGLQLDFIGGVHLKSYIGNIVAGGIELMHSIKESFSLLWRGFYLNLESLHHDCIDTYDLWIKCLTVRSGPNPLATEVASILGQWS